MSDDPAARLAAIVRRDPTLMEVLETVRSLGLPDWRIFSGAIYQAVWNDVTGREPGYGVRDFDVGYFDPDVSWDAEDRVIRRVAAAFEEPLRSRVEVRNQAWVHLWFEGKFGEPYEALTCTDEALAGFVSPAFAVGVRLEDDGSISVAAPFGLADVFGLVVRPNLLRPPAKGWERATASVLARWPELRVITPQT